MKHFIHAPIKALLMVAVVSNADEGNHPAAWLEGYTGNIHMARNDDIYTNQSERSLSSIFNTADGPVIGLQEGKVLKFLGVPFAAPPIGDLRFRSPQRPSPWKNPLKVTSRGSVCPQLDLLGPGKVILLGDEDCLRLDVYVPDECTPSTPCAVMQWIYGGGWTLGDKYEFGAYDGAVLAKAHGVIVVAANYRLDVLGWIALDALSEEDEEGASGNYGLQRVERMRRSAPLHDYLDRDTHVLLLLSLPQRSNRCIAVDSDEHRSIRWRPQPSDDIWRSSAGGFSVCQHLVSPASNGLFSAAIVESGDCDGPWLIRAGVEAKQAGLVYSEAVGCTKDAVAKRHNESLTACLRSLDVQRILKPMLTWVAYEDWPFRKHTENISWMPHAADWRLVLPPFYPVMSWTAVVDGTKKGLPDSPLFLIREGKINTNPSGGPLKVMMGTNHDEGMLFVGATPLVIPGVKMPINTADMDEIVQYVTTHHDYWNVSTAQAILSTYPSSEFGSEEARLGTAMTNFVFTCGTRNALKALANANIDVYAYHFDFHFDGYTDPNKPGCQLTSMLLCGVFHGVEVPLVWNDVLAMDSKAEKAVSGALQSYWASFAKRGSPNEPNTSLPEWEPYNPMKDNYLLIAHDGEIVPTLDVYKKECDFWSSLPEHDHYDPGR